MSVTVPSNGGRVYATAAQLADWPGGSAVPDDDAPILLALASRTVEVLLTARRYPVDDSGMPTDSDDQDDMCNATCAIAASMQAAGGLSGESRQWSSVSIGNLSLSGPLSGAVIVDGVPVPPLVATLLRNVGCRHVWAWL